ncbi:GNAT family N-acetyltransferase [Flagellimonas sp.]|uniref:GNAT family N-acetyltransferase n=1 Tax=Flagellimonas sp. TaxID=2058762 RepID=UPI003B518AD2
MIRKHTSADLEQLIHIWREATALAHHFLDADLVSKIEKDMREVYLPDSQTWVYEEDGEVVGFISMANNEIGGLFVLTDEHARGIGTALVNYVGLLFEQLEVEVFVKNQIGRAFYNKYGFRPIKKYRHLPSQEMVLRLECATRF